jgi:hypothetical protein
VSNSAAPNSTIQHGVKGRRAWAQAATNRIRCDRRGHARRRCDADQSGIRFVSPVVSSANWSSLGPLSARHRSSHRSAAGSNFGDSLRLQVEELRTSSACRDLPWGVLPLARCRGRCVTPTWTTAS